MLIPRPKLGQSQKVPSGPTPPLLHSRLVLWPTLRTYRRLCGADPNLPPVDEFHTTWSSKRSGTPDRRSNESSAVRRERTRRKVQDGGPADVPMDRAERQDDGEAA